MCHQAGRAPPQPPPAPSPAPGPPGGAVPRGVLRVRARMCSCYCFVRNPGVAKEMGTATASKPKDWFKSAGAASNARENTELGFDKTMV